MYDRPPPTLKTLQIVVIALFMGMMTASGVFAMLHVTGSAKPSSAGLSPELLAGILGALALGTATMMLIVPPALIRQGAARYRAQETDEGKQFVLMQTLSTSTIIRCAMVEGVGLFGAVAFFITGMWPLLAAPALAGLLILSFFPTEGKLRRARERLEMTAV